MTRKNLGEQSTSADGPEWLNSDESRLALGQLYLMGQRRILSEATCGNVIVTSKGFAKVPIRQTFD